MLDTDTRLDLEVLEELDFPVSCSHPTHGSNSPWHDEGDAKWIYTFSGPCGFRVVRPVCDRFALTLHRVGVWTCSGCGADHDASEVEVTAVPLDRLP